MLLGPTPQFWDGEYGFSALGVDAVPGNGCGIQGQSYVEFFQGSGPSVGRGEMECLNLSFSLIGALLLSVDGWQWLGAKSLIWGCTLWFLISGFTHSFCIKNIMYPKPRGLDYKRWTY